MRTCNLNHFPRYHPPIALLLSDYFRRSAQVPGARAQTAHGRARGRRVQILAATDLQSGEQWHCDRRMENHHRSAPQNQTVLLAPWKDSLARFHAFPELRAHSAKGRTDRCKVRITADLLFGLHCAHQIWAEPAEVHSADLSSVGIQQTQKHQRSDALIIGFDSDSFVTVTDWLTSSSISDSVIVLGTQCAAQYFSRR